MLHNSKYVIQNNHAYVIIFAGKLNAAHGHRVRWQLSLKGSNIRWRHRERRAAGSEGEDEEVPPSYSKAKLACSKIERILQDLSIDKRSDIAESIAQDF
jgi:hypothetical protein